MVVENILAAVAEGMVSAVEDMLAAAECELVAEGMIVAAEDVPGAVADMLAAAESGLAVVAAEGRFAVEGRLVVEYELVVVEDILAAVVEDILAAAVEDRLAVEIWLLGVGIEIVIDEEIDDVAVEGIAGSAVVVVDVLLWNFFPEFFDLDFLSTLIALVAPC